MTFKSSLFAAMLVLTGVGQALAQTRIVTGTVTDATTGQPVIAGLVGVAGTTISTSITSEGTFSLAAPVGGVTLEIASIGFRRARVIVAANQSSVQVPLEPDVFRLEEIVVTGQATGIARQNVAHSVTTVTGDVLSQVPAVSVDQALMARIPGAEIIKSSGAPGGSAVVNLRGITSINGATEPLYIVDGVYVSDIKLPRGSNFVSQASRGFTIARSGENAVNRIADLNPADIQNVQVLKGAAASAIYGSKASNGVILITTKRGSVGRPRFTLRQGFGVSHISRRVGLRRFQSMEDAVATYGVLAEDPDVGWAPGRFFDNELALAGGTPLHYQTSLSVSGGTETTQYYASALVKHEGGIVTNTFANKRSIRLNIDQQIGNRLTVSVGTDVLNTTGDKGLTINENNNSSYWAALGNTPTFFDLSERADGTFPFNPYVASNPLHTADALKNEEQVWRMIGTARVTLDALNNGTHSLQFVAVGGTDFFHQDNKVFSPPELQFEAVDGLFGTSVASNSRNLNLNINANAVYTYRTPGGTSATTQFGLQYETRELEIERVLAANLVGGLQTINSGTTVLVSADHQYVRDLGFFAQEEFLTLDERLLLTVGVRADQSSNNGDPSKLFWYPKASVSFRFPELGGPLDELKLRAAFGQSGNQPLYGQKFTELQTLNVGGVPAGQIQTSAAASNIVPERQREIEVGFDAVGARANLEVSAYEKRITDVLLARSLPESYGFSSEFLNGGVLRTRGLEVALGVVPAQGRDFGWNLDANFHLWRSIMTELPVPPFGGFGFGGGSIRIEEGQSVTQIGGFDSLPDGTRQQAIVGQTRPDYVIGLSNDIRYKGFRWSMLWDGRQGGVVRDLTMWLYDLNGISRDYDDPAPDGSGRKLGVYRPLVFRTSSQPYLEDASFIKLREMSLSLDVTGAAQRFWGGARNVRLSLTGRDLLTFTGYWGSDPEARWVPERGLARQPPTELWAYPPSRSFWFTIDVGF